MKIRVLGCSGSIAAGSRTTSFLLDDDVLIDAGTGVGDLHARRAGAHRPHPRQPLAPRPRAGDRPAGRQRRSRRRSAAAPPIQRARAAGDDRGAAHAHLQRRDLARLHPPARRAEQPVLALRAVRSRPDADARRARASRCCRPSTPCRRSASRCRRRSQARRLGLHRRHRPEPGAVAAPARHARRPPGDRDRLQRRRARSWPRISQPPVPGRRCGASWRSSTAAGRRPHHPHQAGRGRRRDGADRRAGQPPPHPRAGARARCIAID